MTPKQRLAALIGAGATSLLLVSIPAHEGVVLKGYRDPIGIVTACMGHTATAQLGKRYTWAECERLMLNDLYDHAEGVLRCTPGLRDRPYQLAAATSFAYNVGETKYCESTMARKFNAGDLLGGCAELSRWTKAGGRDLPGLVTRRADERALCEVGLK
jgi:lysozyme